MDKVWLAFEIFVNDNDTFIGVFSSKENAIERCKKIEARFNLNLGESSDEEMLFQKKGDTEWYEWWCGQSKHYPNKRYPNGVRGYKVYETELDSED